MIYFVSCKVIKTSAIIPFPPLIGTTIDNLCISKHEFVDILTIYLHFNNKNILISGIYKSPKADIIDFSDFIYTHFN